MGPLGRRKLAEFKRVGIGRIEPARNGLALLADHTARARRAASAWQLRHSFSFYDALYLALAESLNSPLVTADARIARAQPEHPLILPILHSK